MKKTHLLLIALAGLILIQCSKNGNGKSKPDLNKGLLAYFPFNGQFYDSPKVLTMGTLGIHKYVADRAGKAKSAIFFDSGYIEFKCFGWLANPLTISVWVSANNANYKNYIIKSEQGVFGVTQQSVLSTSKSFGMTVTNITTNSAMAPAEFGWNHFVGTYDGENIKTYIDGVLKSTMHHPGQTGGTNKVLIGSISNPQWKGSFDDMRFYNRILTDEEILLLSQQ
jgi:hypothetical protein